MNNKSSDYIYTKQYDTGRTVVFRITKNGEQMNLSGLTSIFCLKKPDGNFILRSSVDDELVMTNDTITLELTDQITVLSGKLPYQITLCQNDKEVSTVTGYLMCDRAAIQRDDIESVSDGSLLEDLSVVADAIRDGSVFSGDHVSVTQVQQSGTKIAEITVNDVTTDIYSASGGGTTVRQTIVDTETRDGIFFIPLSPNTIGDEVGTSYISELDLRDNLAYNTGYNTLELGNAMDLRGAPRWEEYDENTGYWVDDGSGYLNGYIADRFQDFSLKKTLHEIARCVTPNDLSHAEDSSFDICFYGSDGQLYSSGGYFINEFDANTDKNNIWTNGYFCASDGFKGNDISRLDGNGYWHEDEDQQGFYSLKDTIDDIYDKISSGGGGGGGGDLDALEGLAQAAENGYFLCEGHDIELLGIDLVINDAVGTTENRADIVMSNGYWDSDSANDGTIRSLKTAVRTLYDPTEAISKEEIRQVGDNGYELKMVDGNLVKHGYWTGWQTQSLDDVLDALSGTYYDSGKVTQVNNTDDTNYRVLLSYSANNSETKEIVRKTENLMFNPSSKELKLKDRVLEDDVNVDYLTTVTPEGLKIDRDDGETEEYLEITHNDVVSNGYWSGGFNTGSLDEVLEMIGLQYGYLGDLTAAIQSENLYFPQDGTYITVADIHKPTGYWDDYAQSGTLDSLQDTINDLYGRCSNLDVLNGAVGDGVITFAADGDISTSGDINLDGNIVNNLDYWVNKYGMRSYDLAETLDYMSDYFDTLKNFNTLSYQGYFTATTGADKKVELGETNLELTDISHTTTTEITANLFEDVDNDWAYKFPDNDLVLLVVNHDYDTGDTVGFTCDSSATLQDDLHEEMVYKVAIPSTVDKIRYTITAGDRLDSGSELYVAVASTLDTTNYGHIPLGTELVGNVYNTPNTTIEDELDLFEVTEDCYLYIIGSSWNFMVDSLETVIINSTTTTNRSDIVLSGGSGYWETTSSAGEYKSLREAVRALFNTNTSEIEYLTQAQYDNLSTAQKNNGKIYFVQPNSVSNYEFHESQDGTCVVRINETAGEHLWFFRNYHKEDSDVAPPTELLSYVPSNLVLAANYPGGTGTQNGWIGFYNNNIRSWTQDTGSLMAGNFYGIVDLDDSAESQSIPYYDPYDISLGEYKLYYMSVEYTKNNLNDLVDVVITSPSNNQVLAFDSTASEWKNSTPKILQQTTDTTYPNTEYRLLLTEGANTTDYYGGANYSTQLTYNPSLQYLTITRQTGEKTELTGLSMVVTKPNTGSADNTLTVGYKDIRLDHNHGTWLDPPDQVTNTLTSLRYALSQLSGRSYKVTQTNTTTNTDYSMIFGNSAVSTSDETNYVRKSNKLTYNPYNNVFRVRNITSISSVDTDTEYTNISSYYLEIYHKDHTTGNTISHIQLNTNGWDQYSYDKPFIDINYDYKNMRIKHDDIELSGSSNTWDGTNTSLKTALGNLCKVKQDQITSSGDRPLLFSTSTSTSSVTDSVGKYQDFTFNPSTKTLKLYGESMVLGTNDNFVITEYTTQLTSTSVKIQRENPSKTEYLDIGYNDIVMTNTWDGTNTSLKSALAAISGGGGGGGATTLNGLTDVTISSPSNGQVLTYNSTSSKWENTTGNNYVSQTATTDEFNMYEVLFSYTPDDNTTRSEGARKASSILVNPGSSILRVANINGGYSTVDLVADFNPYVYVWKSSSAIGLKVKADDIILEDDTVGGTSNNWDGTNTSLKTAVTSAKGTVTQTAITTNATYELLFSGTADNTTRTEGVGKSGGLTYNPSSSRLEVLTPNSGSTIITGLSVSVSGILHGGCNVTMTGDDITIASSGNTQTWDGTNTSLRDAITALSNRISALGG